ncbi:MAG TPA: tetratricopeptide repeat protein [Kofleriaceae bacterium]|nr:tetratricopeptide repeat protein [Kofleriaceae bacterium]
MRTLVIAIIVVGWLGGPVRADDTKQKRAATVLLKKGNELFAAGDYQGALDLFQSAYATYPSSKIVLNIGTTLKALGQYVEAAETYESYLASADAAPERVAEVNVILEELDRTRLGKLRIVARDVIGRVQLDARDLGVYTAPIEVRVRPGNHSVVLVRDGEPPIAATPTARIGEVVEVVLAAPVAAPPEPVAIDPPADRVPIGDDDDDDDGGGLGVFRAPEPEFSRFSGLLFADLDFKLRGAALFGGLGYALTPDLDLVCAALIGAHAQGGYLGATLRLLDGRLKPLLGAGVPVFFSDGPRAAVRATAGVSISPFPRLDVGVELGLEHYFNPEMGYAQTFVLPAVGVRARL